MNGPSYSAAELLSRLVHFDTTSHKSNLPLIAFVEDYLEGRTPNPCVACNARVKFAWLLSRARVIRETALARASTKNLAKMFWS